MREIKFRGKRVDNGEWIYGFYWHNTNTETSRITILTESSLYIDIEVIPETVGQFTGLIDKNGKEIYEGDVVRYDDISDLGESLGEVAVVEYMYEQCCFDPLAIGYGGCYYSRYIENTEVIGNIHDNPELLK